ncbi:hypothetical protein D9758_008686 [Tetrapyrgos nigripes]|uniref:Uncharacterized protein n=1 Tax=Tetrapyrgos nigripes TaxID=182062 RepID=A0A8H5FYK5_9AGAR|nr:hypothetical protein D9758_008686 [Tetrapyrgos nigripes]
MSPHFTTVFLFIASLLTAMILGLEILHPFAAAFLPPNVSQALEWQSCLHSSALGFGAVLFVLYQLFFISLLALFSCSMRILKWCGINWVVEKRGESEGDLPVEEKPSSWLSPEPICSALLVTVLILNDAIYNRAEGSPLIRGSFDRLLSIILEALPMSLFEMPVLVALVYVISCWMDKRSESKMTRSQDDLEAQAPNPTSQCFSGAKVAAVSGFLPGIDSRNYTPCRYRLTMQQKNVLPRTQGYIRPSVPYYSCHIVQ